METKGKIRIERGNEYLSLHNNLGLQYYMCYNELIDNSIDNNATEIRMEYSSTGMTIHDNGDGIKDTIEDMRRVLRMYKSSSNGSSDKIGQYGLGLKEATMRLGKGITIRSRAKGCKPIQIDVPWSTIDYEEGASFNIVDDDTPYGTSITVYFVPEETPTPPGPKKLSYRFYDRMILDGKLKIIDINGNVYEPDPEPVFDTNMFEKRTEIVQGKTFELTIGILPSNIARSRSGFYVYSTETLRYFNYGDTILSEGVEARDGLYVLIGLHKTKKNWPVDKNKRGIMNIYEIAQHLDFIGIIGKWQQRIYKAVSNDILNKLKREMAPVFGLNAAVIGEEKRPNKGDNKGTVEPKGTDRRRLEAEVVASHDNKIVVKRESGKAKLFNIVEGHFSSEKYLSVSTIGSTLTVTLNRNNRWIHQILNKPDAFKTESLANIITIAIKAYRLPNNEIQYKPIVDHLFYQDEYITQRYGSRLKS